MADGLFSKERFSPNFRCKVKAYHRPTGGAVGFDHDGLDAQVLVRLATAALQVHPFAAHLFDFTIEFPPADVAYPLDLSPYLAAVRRDGWITRESGEEMHQMPGEQPEPLEAWLRRTKPELFKG